MRLLRVFVASVLTALVLPLLGSAPAEAAGPIRFARVQYDSPGSDTGSNRSLNAEWVAVTNTGRERRVMTGWSVRDRTGYVYRFPRGYVLRPGATVRIHTGRGSNTRTDLYWRRTWYVWNNDGDRAVLRRSGSAVDACRWGDGSGSIAC